MKLNNNFINGIEKELNVSTTTNGAVAYNSSLNYVLDAFGTLGSARNWDDYNIIKAFNLAYRNSEELATKLLFWLRDARGGAGERNTFRTILKYCTKYHPNIIYNNIDNIAYYGRYDDYLILLDTNFRYEISSYLLKQIETDYLNFEEGVGDISLLAKWLPSVNTSSETTRRYANMLISDWGWTPKRYRKTLAKLRKHLDVTEVKMTSNRWGEINYENVPSKASTNYIDAFYRHDSERYDKYLDDVANGKAKINASTLFPVDIISKVRNYNNSVVENKALDAQWNALPNYFEGKNEFGLAVVDTSGSMYGTPINVAISLGLYLADKAEGPFKGKFITFSEQPELQTVIGNTITEKVKNMSSAHWDMNTNLEAVFELILNVAVKNHLRQEELPSKLYIISDMQFDAATARRGRNYYYSTPTCIDKQSLIETIREEYKQYGYEVPALVYWNVNSYDKGMFQDTVDNANWCMVSGYSASLFKSVIEGTTYEVEKTEEGTIIREKINPIDIMLNTLNSERYDRVVV